MVDILNNTGAKILHLINDTVFIDTAISSFEEVLPRGNEFLHIGNKNKFHLIKNNQVKQVPRRLIFRAKFRNYLKSFDAIIFHSFSRFEYFVVALLAPAKTKKMWIGWGFDYYNLVYKEEELLKTETLNLYRMSCPNKLKKTLLKYAKGKVRELLNFLVRKKGIQCIDFFSPVIYEDYKLVINKNPWIKAEYLAWNYGVANRMQSKNIFCGENILVGNSASYTNNHVEVFRILARCDLAGRKIICPLNYGDEQYARYIITLGKELFGKAFTPLTEFMDFNDYVALLSSCTLVFMNHLRQQATGNIYIAIMSGAKVFLDPLNPLFKHYVNLGLKVFSIHDFDQVSFSRLSEEDVQHNRTILKKASSKEMILEKTFNVIKRLLKS